MGMQADELPPDASSGGAPFNMALASLQRLHFLRMNASDARRERNVNDWITILDSAYSEIVSMVKLTPDEEKDIKKVRDEFYGITKDHNRNTTCYKSRVDSGKRIVSCNHEGRAFFALSEYDLSLSRVQFAHNLAMSGKDDPRRAFK